MSERLEAVAELIGMAGEEASVAALTSALNGLAKAIEERDRYRKALVLIADSESGVWGKWASDALREKDAA